MQEEYNIYGGFALLYDRFMDNIPYDDWYQYLHGILTKHGVSSGIVVDLACGTGEITRRLAADGYQMIGTDLSEEMLAVARQKCSQDILWLHQDMRELDLYGSVSAMVCLCDGMNYICSSKELETVFHRVFTFLEPGGVFVFDMKTAYFFREILGNRVFSDNREDASYIWENVYRQEEQLNEYLLTIYRLVDREKALFERTDELHRQRAYDIEAVTESLKKQGFARIEVMEAFTGKKPGKQCERLYFIAEK